MTSGFEENNVPLVLDGATGTELEKRGVNVNDPLWSGLAVVENPEELTSIHLDYLKNGSDMISTATYQLSDEHLKERGFSNTLEIYTKAVSLCANARKQFIANQVFDTDSKRRKEPLIIGSIGPYGAGLANGSEYTGDYGSATAEDILAFHHGRFEALLNNDQVDVLGFETMPNFLELKSLIELLSEAKNKIDKPFYISFSVGNENELADSTSIDEVVKYLSEVPTSITNRLIAIGANCFGLGNSIKVVKSFNSSLKKYGTSNLSKVKLIIYPNSGEVYDGIAKTWSWDEKLSPHSDHDHLDNHEKFAQFAKSWIDEGNVGFIGGCCRTGPNDINVLRKLVDSL